MSLLLLHARDADQQERIERFPKAQVLEQKARLIEEGLAQGAVIRDGLSIGWVKNFRLTAAGHRRLEKLETSVERNSPVQSRPWTSEVRIFISHSNADESLAEALANLLERALRIRPEAIRCTSVVGYSLPTGADIDDQLRLEIEQSAVLIALITEASLSSTYVLFELGARWVLRKPLFPVVAAGMKPSALHEPLKALVAASCDERGSLLNLLESLGVVLELPTTKPTAYEKAMNDLVARSKASRRKATIPQPSKSSARLDLSSLEIVALQSVGEACFGPLLAEEVASFAVVSIARARQAIESIRKKGLITCRPLQHGDVRYARTELGNAWLVQNTQPEEL